MKRWMVVVWVELVLASWPSWAAPRTVEGPVEITSRSVTVIGGETFLLSPGFATECQDGPRSCDMQTLAGVGYVQKARLTVDGDKVLRLDILELLQ